MGSKARCVTCNDCYFRKTSLCALDLPEPCPTFRPVLRGAMISPRQAPLVEQPPRSRAGFALAPRLAAGAA